MKRGKKPCQKQTSQDAPLIEDFSERLIELVSTIGAWIQVVGGKILNFFRHGWQNTMRSFTQWADPRLNKYREKPLKKSALALEEISQDQPVESKNNAESESDNQSHDIELSEIASDTQYFPKTLEEFLEVLDRTPTSVITEQERAVIAGAMNFNTTKVRKVMIPVNRIVYVKSDEVLGPLVLDELYRADYTHFPVVDAKDEIIGILHTASFNHLTSKDTPVVKDIVDKHLYFLRSDYSLEQALVAFFRSNCQLMLVIDKGDNLVGMLTFQKLIEYLTGPIEEDDFSRDGDRQAVLSR